MGPTKRRPHRDVCINGGYLTVCAVTAVGGDELLGTYSRWVNIKNLCWWGDAASRPASGSPWHVPYEATIRSSALEPAHGLCPAPTTPASR